MVLDPGNKDGFGPDVTVVDSGQTVNLKDALTRLRSPSKEDDQPYDLLMLQAARYSGTWIKDRGQSFVLESGVLKRVSVEGLNDVNLIGMFNHTGQFAYVEAPKAGYGTFGHVMIQDASGTRDLGPVPGSEGTYLSTMDDAGNLIAAINLFGNFYGGTYYSSAQGYWYQFESLLPSAYAGYRDVDYGALSPDGHIVLTLMKDGSPSKVVVLTPAVPEPATLGLMSLGLLALSAAAIRRQRASGTTTSAPCSA